MIVKIIIGSILLSFATGAIYSVVRWRMKNKCKHKYIIDNYVVMGKKVLLFCKCEDCDKYKDFEVWNDRIQINIGKCDKK